MRARSDDEARRGNVRRRHDLAARRAPDAVRPTARCARPPRKPRPAPGKAKRPCGARGIGDRDGTVIDLHDARTTAPRPAEEMSSFVAEPRALMRRAPASLPSGMAPAAIRWRGSKRAAPPSTAAHGAPISSTASASKASASQWASASGSVTCPSGPCTASSTSLDGAQTLISPWRIAQSSSVRVSTTTQRGSRAARHQAPCSIARRSMRRCGMTWRGARHLRAGPVDTEDQRRARRLQDVEKRAQDRRARPFRWTGTPRPDAAPGRPEAEGADAREGASRTISTPSV
jgi:hypothetical protein